MGQHSDKCLVLTHTHTHAWNLNFPREPQDWGSSKTIYTKYETESEHLIFCVPQMWAKKTTYDYVGNRESGEGGFLVPNPADDQEPDGG